MLPVVYGLIFLALMLAGWTLTRLVGTTGVHHYQVSVERVEQRLRGMFVFSNAQHLVWFYLLCLLLVPLLIWMLLGSVVPAAGVLLFLLYIPRVILRRLELKRRQAISQGLPDVLDQMAAAMLSGTTLTSAMQAVATENRGPLGQEITLLLSENRLGTSLEDALENMGERVKSEEMDLVITAALIAREVGGNLGETFRRLSGTLRRKIEMEGKVRALTSQGVLQGRIVSLLPFGVLAALWLLERQYVNRIFDSLLGWIVLGLIILLEFAGGSMIRKIIRIDI